MAVLVCLSTSCGSYLSQPVDFEAPRAGEISETTKRLRKLPAPEEKVVVGVYNFRDLTGQYKPSDVGSTFSTAVTQGATSILVKALEDSGWFTAIERENIAQNGYKEAKSKHSYQKRAEQLVNKFNQHVTVSSQKTFNTKKLTFYSNIERVANSFRKTYK